MPTRKSSRRIIVYGFLLVIALLAAITGTGLYRIQTLYTGLGEIVRERDVQIALMQKMQQMARERSIILQSMLILKDPFTVDDYALQMSAAASQYVAARESLLEHKLPDRELEMLERQHAQTVATASSQNAIVNHLRNEEYDAASSLLFHAVLPGQRRAMKLMDEFIELKRKQNLESLNNTSANIEHTYGLMLLLNTVGVLISILVAIAIHRRISNEIALRLETENILRHSELRERTIRENMLDGLLTLDAQGKILSCNKACKAIFGYEMENMAGQSAHILLPYAIAEDKGGDLSRHLEVWEKRMLGMGREVLGRRADGSTFPAEIDLSKIVLEGDPLYIVVIRDITEKKEAEKKLQRFNQELENRVIARTEELARTNVQLRHEIEERIKMQQQLTHMATHDALTGLPNRTLFAEQLESALHTAARHKRQLALLFIDLDGFKAVNDTYGHAAGDRLLTEISQRMRACIRKEDILARMGGDEFTIVLRELHQPDDAQLVAAKLIKAINEPVALNSHTSHVGASIGIALFPQSAQDPESLLRMADDAMYLAKSSGKNRCCIADERSAPQTESDPYPLF